MAKHRLQLWVSSSRRADAVQKKRRKGRISTKTSIEDEIAHLRGLDLRGLRARWQTVFQRSAPAHLTRHLLFAVIASLDGICRESEASWLGIRATILLRKDWRSGLIG